MIKNIIFGRRSELTSFISKKLDKVEIISTTNLDLDKLKSLNNHKLNLVFNNFYPSHKLNQLEPSNYKEFVDLSLGRLVEILNYLQSVNINKIIYTSSASVYNLEENLTNLEFDKFNRKIYASLKYTSERIIENFCRKEKIRFYIMRLFNTYGSKNDKFSFIDNLIKIKKNNLNLRLINNGISIRDFIYLDDVAIIFKKFLENNNYETGIYDIGTGEGRLIKNLVNFVGIKEDKIIKTNNVNEITKSIANTKKLFDNLGVYKFRSLESYFKSKISLKIKNKIYSTKIANKKTYNKGSVIYGAGFAGKKLCMKLMEQNEKIIFFVDDDIKKQNTIFCDIPVIGYRDLIKLSNRKIVDKLYIAIPSLQKKKINKINIKLSKSFFDVRHLPEKKFLINDHINLNDIKIEQINSLLNRKQINIEKISYLKGKNVLVTGAAGTIGFEICRQLIYHNANKVIGIDHSEISIYSKNNQSDKKIQLVLCDVNDVNLMGKIIKKNKIDIIIHAAAYKHVNILENNIFSAIGNNIIGTKNVCELAKNYNVNLVLISTDKAADPKSVLGLTKKVCEKIVDRYGQTKKNKFFNIVRFGNVFGSSGSAVIRFIEQINNNKVVTITNKNASRFFMSIFEACFLVLKTTSISIKNKIFILNMGKPINIFQLARKLGQLKKDLDPNYKMKFIETGLKKNEKLHEKLFEKNETLLKVDKDIFYVSKRKLDIKKFDSLFFEFEKNYKFLNKKAIINRLNSICRA